MPFLLFVGTQREDTTVIVHYSVRLRGSASAPRVAVTRGSLNLTMPKKLKRYHGRGDLQKGEGRGGGVQESEGGRDESRPTQAKS
jgi:hypothetical protein